MRLPWSKCSAASSAISFVDSQGVTLSRPMLVWIASLLLAGCGSPAQRAAEAGAEAQQLLEAGQSRQAVARLEYALRQRDDLPGLWLLLGRAKSSLRDAPGAYMAYKNALDQDPGSREALYALSQLSLAARNFSQAEEYIERLLLLVPGDPNALVIRGLAALGLGRINDASETADDALKADPANEPALVIKSMIAYRNGDLAQAAHLLEGPFSRGTPNPDVLQHLRRIYRRTADVRKLLSVTRRIAELQPSDNAAQLDLAKSFYLLRDSASASAVLLKLPERAASARREALIAMWFDTGTTPQQLSADLALRSRAWLQLAFAEYCLRAGLPRLALERLKGEAKRTPNANTVDHHAVLTLAELALNDRQGARNRAQMLLELDPRQPSALIARGRLALAQRQFDSALRDARMVIADNPSLGQGYSLLADIYKARGESVMADKAVIDASSANADSVEQLQYYAYYFQRRAKMEQVLELVRDFTARNPVSKSGWLLRLTLCRNENDLRCIATSSEFLRRLSGGSIDYTIPVENTGPSADEELFEGGDR
jgi:tetratricopeptide (TPR) repeat protein